VFALLLILIIHTSLFDIVGEVDRQGMKRKRKARLTSPREGKRGCRFKVNFGWAAPGIENCLYLNSVRWSPGVPSQTGWRRKKTVVPASFGFNCTTFLHLSEYKIMQQSILNISMLCDYCFILIPCYFSLLLQEQDPMRKLYLF
jgi:hypothetical protein